LQIETDPQRGVMEAMDAERTVVWRRGPRPAGLDNQNGLSTSRRPAQPAPPTRDSYVLLATLPKGDSNIWEGDVDHDGHKELWFAYDGAVHVWEAQGRNPFVHVHSAPPPSGQMTWFLGIGDTDNDGLQEIIWKAGIAGDPYLVFYEQPNLYTYPSVATAEHHTGVENTHYTHLRVADIDQDGVNDVICSHQGTSDRSVAVYEAFADDTYREVYGGNYGPEYAVSGCVGVGDLDGDGFREIAVPEVSDAVRIHIVEAQGNNNYVDTWTSDWLPDPNGYWVSEGGDLDRDGLPDFVVVTGHGGFTEPVVFVVWMYEAVGNDEYELVWSHEYTATCNLCFDGGVVTGDATGDGYSDLLFQAASSLTAVFTGVADNTLQMVWSLDGAVTGQGRERLISSDLDADGQPELVWYTDSATVVYEHVSGSESCTYTVCPDGTGDFVTIQAAINAAADGDVICLCEATFTGEGNRDIDYSGKAVTVQAQSSNPAACVIDCENSGWRAVKFISGEGPASVLAGVTIRNGVATRGGAIYCSGTSPTIRRCIITGNAAIGPTAHFGGGIYCANGAEPTIAGCVISGNYAQTDGGGICLDDASATIVSSTIAGNFADNNGGGICQTGQIDMDNSIVWGNGAGGEGDNWYCSTGSIVLNCSDTQQDGKQLDPACAETGANNIHGDPLFCDPVAYSAAPTTTGNYHLQAGSSCAPQQQPLCGLLGALAVQCQACCLPEPAAQCVNTDLYDCIARGGTPLGSEDLCAGEEEACCLDGGTCAMLEPPCCVAAGGRTQGPGSDCAALVCLEACCLGEGACADLPPDECLPDGVPQGAGSVCLGDEGGNGVDDACEGMEACCAPEGTCTSARPDDCPFGSIPLGPGSWCLGDANGDGSDDACQNLQACCLTDGGCTWAEPADCWPAGFPQGPYSQCLGDGDGNGVDDVCEPPDECADQACDAPNGAVRNIYYFMPIGQEFVPAISAHVGVEVLLDDFNPGGPAVPVTVKIRAGTITGPVVPGSQVQVTPTGAGWRLFPFAQTVYLEPEATYVIEVSVTASRWAWPSAPGLCYPDGNGYLSGGLTGSDNCFRTLVGCFDCNDNGIPDPQDIAAGTSLDCNHNAIPDECDAIGAGDFNADGAIDWNDFDALTECLAGPDQLPVVPVPACLPTYLQAFDFETDGDVDLRDVAQFQIGFSGPGE